MSEAGESDQVRPWDIPWTFAVAWDPARGTLPLAILKLFRHRSIIEPGRATRQTDQGHATYYVRAVETFVSKYHPTRDDIEATAEITTPPGPTS